MRSKFIEQRIVIGNFMAASTITLTNSLQGAVVLIGKTEGPSVILPSSLDSTDCLPRHLSAGMDHRVLVPGSLRARLGSVIGRRSWRTVTLLPLGVEVAQVTLPVSILDAKNLMVACDIDVVAHGGPFVLDLAACYVDMSTRMRILARGKRSGSAAEVNLVVRITWSVLAVTFEGSRWYAVSSDVVAAELAALALSELVIGKEVGFSGPWEDAIVQRATELDLGATLPEYIEVRIDDGYPASRSGIALRDHLVLRLGLPQKREF